VAFTEYFSLSNLLKSQSSELKSAVNILVVEID